MDMRFDYNFRLAKRAEGVTYRIDYSNQPGYWGNFVGLSKQPEANHNLHGAIYDLSAKETILDKIKTFLNKATWSHVYKDASSFVFDEVLGDVNKECVGERTSVTASIYAEARGSITSKLAFGISIMVGLPIRFCAEAGYRVPSSNVLHGDARHHGDARRPCTREKSNTFLMFI